MRNPLLISFLSVLAMLLVMRWQGAGLVSPVSPGGILDLEFARTAAKLHQLKLFWSDRDLSINIYLDFLFIASYVWFLVTACRRVGWRKEKWGRIFSGIAITAGCLDVLENCFMLLVWDGSLGAGWLQAVNFSAMIKFILAGITILYLLFSLPFLFRQNAKD